LLLQDDQKAIWIRAYTSQCPHPPGPVGYIDAHQSESSS
jgi:hypothetical protein